MNSGVLQRMTKFFRGKSVIAAYSGGTDSSALLHFLKGVPDLRLSAVTASGPHMPAEELSRAGEFCRQFGVEHMFIPVNPLEVKEVRNNDRLRCYHCKLKVFSALKRKAIEDSVDLIIDGTNIDDKSDYRPGMKALSELGVFSPFLEFGIGKEQIRRYMRASGLEKYIHPSNACLITRLPYGVEITKETLSDIDHAEDFIRSLGVSQVRCRLHGNLARIEVEKKDMGKLLTSREKISRTLAEKGFKYITMDLQGYKTGGAD